MSAGLDADLAGDEVFVSLFPVHRACRDGDLGALVSLVRHFSSLAHLTVEDSCCGWTPIHWAAHYGQLECVAHLVQMGCEVNLVTSRFNQTPTHIAAFGGHPHCVVWLTQAGADVNRQDFVGEAPIHKAAQSGSLECIQILLRAGAIPHLRNASGQTAADLAHAHGFHDCFRLVSKAHLGGLDVNRVQSGNGAPCGQDLLGRKRLLTAVHTGHEKKARTADDVWVQTQSRGGEEWESMNVESEALSSDDIDASTNGHHHTTPRADSEPPRSPASPSSHPANQQSGAPGQQALADMSPSWCVSYPAPCLGQMDSDDFLYYGHYHGFGDTAEELPHFSR